MVKQGWTSVIGMMLILCGCGGETNKPIPLDTGVKPQSQLVPEDARRVVATDRPGDFPYDDPRRQPAPNLHNEKPAIADAVANTIRSPRDVAVERAGLGTSASTLPMLAADKRVAPGVAPGVGVGNAMLLGTVVVEVNGHPIFANKVLQTIAPVLAAKAKDLNAARFRALAMDEIHKQLQTLIADELQFALAERNLDANDKHMADARTMQWRDQQIRKYGGSLQLAKQAAAAQGLDFDELVQDQSRLSMRQVYFARKELPNIQISADDIRRFYQQHKDDLFSERSQAQFRVIKIDFDRTGGREKALAKANDLHARVAKGEDFATIAGEINDDPFLMRNKGDVTAGAGWIDRGAYVNQKVETAVWNLHNGEITPVIETNNAFYIAKLEQKKVGRVESFDEEAVQSKIRQMLEAEQMTVMQQQMTERLLQNAIVYPDPPNIDPVVEMAMQKYVEWTK